MKINSGSRILFHQTSNEMKNELDEILGHNLLVVGRFERIHKRVTWFFTGFHLEIWENRNRKTI
jgi:hypothetical protein